ncbi:MULTISPECIES: hypothetical protein [unclassified Streptomyces]|uniref:hypothetical protein n=1 Tax=unclassified Streptomyces TaxID=2593676 RepID=UPI003800596E
MSFVDTDAPIYALLIRERGDVPADVSRTAEQVLRELERTMNMYGGSSFPTSFPAQR